MGRMGPRQGGVEGAVTAARSGERDAGGTTRRWATLDARGALYCAWRTTACTVVYSVYFID